MTRSILFWRASSCSTHSAFLSNRDRKIIYLLPVFTESFLLCKSDYFQLHHCSICFSEAARFHHPWLVLEEERERKPFFCWHVHYDRCLFVVLGTPAACKRLPSCGAVRTLSSQSTLFPDSHPTPVISLSSTWPRISAPAPHFWSRQNCNIAPPPQKSPLPAILCSVVAGTTLVATRPFAGHAVLSAGSAMGAGRKLPLPQ